MHSGGLRRWCTCASWLQRVADLEELGDVRATHDRCDHCCATVVGVDLDTEGAGGVGAHRHTERGSLVHEEQSVPLRRGVAAHCRRRRPACGVHSRREHESGRHRDGTVSRFRTFVATWPSPSRSDFHARGSRAFLFLLRSELAEVAALAREMASFRAAGSGAYRRQEGGSQSPRRASLAGGLEACGGPLAWQLRVRRRAWPLLPPPHGATPPKSAKLRIPAKPSARGRPRVQCGGRPPTP